MKNIQLRGISDTLYFNALEWKGKLHCETWEDLFKKIFESDDVLNLIAEKEKEEKNSAGIKWAASIDSRLDQRDKEILKNKEDVLV